MITIKSKAVTLKSGTILCWKEYNIFTRLWSKVSGKKLDYNRFRIVVEPLDLISFNGFNSVAYAPVRDYNKKELAKLTKLVKANKGSDTFEDTTVLINAIRPKTFDKATTLDDCKYYKKIDLNEDAIEYIYKVE